MDKSSVTGENYFTYDVNKVIIDMFIESIGTIAPNRPPLGSDECLPPSETAYAPLPINAFLSRTFLVACADQSRSILLSNNFKDREYAIEFLRGLYLSVAVNIATLTPDAKNIILLQLDLLSSNPNSYLIPGATLLDTFDRIIAGFDNPTAAPTPDPTVAPTNAPTDELPTMDIPTTADTLGFTTLVAALQATHLDVFLGDPPNPGPLTVFAPSNDAFAKLGDDLLGCLLKPENVLVLQDILNYHWTYLYGAVLAGDLTNGQRITMANGKDIEVTIIVQALGGDLVIINNGPGGAVVQAANVMATNGVIHAIDTVLIPPGLDVAGFLNMCLATDPPVPAPTTPNTPAPQPEPTPEPTPELTPEPTPKPTRSSKSSKKGRRNPSKS